MPKKKKVHKKRSNQKRLHRIIILILTLIILYIIWKGRRYYHRFESFGLLGLFIFNVLANATVFLPVPSFVAVFVGGAVWKPITVGLVSGVGSAIGELVGYYLGFGGRAIINHLENKRGSIFKFEKWFKKSGFLTVFIASALPDPFFDAVGILAGTLNYSVVKFFLATAAGRVVRNIIIAWSGAKIIP